MKRRTRQNPFALPTFALLFVFALLILTQLGCNGGDKEDGDTDPTLGKSGAGDERIGRGESWGVDVKNACLVDTETVEAGVTSEVTEPQRIVGMSTGGNIEDPAITCARAEKKAKRDLSKKIWEAGNEKCQEWEKAPDGGEDCKAVRSDLHGPDISCECDTSNADPVVGGTVNTKCKGPEVNFVCDP